MVVLTSISLALVLAAVGAFLYGTIQISRYAFRISTAHGLAALLFPPYTFYFAFYGFDEQGKEGPAAAWTFGILVGTILTLLFFQPLQLLVTGQLDQLRAQTPEGAATATESTSDDNGGESDSDGEEPEPESVPAKDSEEADEGEEESGSAEDESSEQKTDESDSDGE